MPLKDEPIDLKLTADHDLYLGPDLRLAWTTGKEAVAQGCKIRLQMFQGEWFLNLDSGVPYWTDILGKKYDEVKVLAAMRNALVTTPGVLAVPELKATFNKSTRKLTVTWRVTTEFGDTDPDTLEI